MNLPSLYPCISLYMLLNVSLPPQFPQRLAQLGVVQVWILIRQLPAGRLRPDHEGIHGSLDVRFILQWSVSSYGHGHQGPVVSLKDLRDGVPYASWKPVVILGVQLLAQTSEQRHLAVGACRWGRSIGVGLVLGHGAVCARWAARLVADTFVMLLCHF